MPIFNSGSVGGISDPQTKSNGQILVYNGTEWVAQNPAVSSVNNKTGAVTLTASDINAASTTHASRHKTGGADPIAPADIGAMPVAYDSGNATISSTYCQDGTGSSFWWRMGRLAFARASFRTQNTGATYTDYIMATGFPAAKVRTYSFCVDDKLGVVPEISINTSGQLIFHTRYVGSVDKQYNYNTIFYVTAS